MGSVGSALRKQASGSSSAGLGELPESCVAMVLMYLEPNDICRLAKLNRAFSGASSADFVWETKLPSNYQRLMEVVFDDDKFPRNLCKKDIYAMLCRSNSFEGGTKKFWLDKSTGGISLAFSPKGLTITGIDDRRYWNHIPSEESSSTVRGISLSKSSRYFPRSHTSSKSGGLRSMGKSSSHSRQGPTACSSSCSWGGRSRGSATASAIPSTSMAGTRSLFTLSC